MSSRIDPPGPVVLGSTVDLVCEASVGDLPINFTWTDPNGVSVNSTDINGTASITLSSGGYGKYNCTATNEFGMNTAVLNVVLAGTAAVLIVQLAEFKFPVTFSGLKSVSCTYTCSLSFCWAYKWLHCYS